MTEKNCDYENVDCEDEDVDEYTLSVYVDKEDMKGLITFLNKHGFDWEMS